MISDSVGWLMGWLDGWLTDWLVSESHGWLVVQSGSQLVCSLFVVVWLVVGCVSR